ncbi:hypothetical protein [Streptomyces sp. NPDC058989]|uniref:hypothetical protein n=1 Tax=Streptomyces sp. NPDC058989 TaxID=3346686 RepID=UPI003689603A
MRQVRGTIRKTVAAAAALAGGALLTLGVSADAAHAAGAAGEYQGCPSGYVCLYPNAGWNGGHPTYKWYTYGAHNISNQFGVKRLFNNQTGGAIARNCTGYNGTGCQGIQSAGTYADYNYTPYNSVLLARN